MAVNYTTNLNAAKPDDGTPDWGQYWRAMSDDLEARLATQYAGDPNGNVAGFWVGQTCTDTTNSVIYVCTTATGVAGTSVWQDLETFLSLGLPTYAGNAGELVRVNGTADGLETVDYLAEAHEWNAGQNWAASTITFSASMSWNMGNDPNFRKLTITGTGTLGFTNLKYGVMILWLAQDATGGRDLTLTSVDFGEYTFDSTTMAANEVAIIAIYCDGTNLKGTFLQAF